MNPGLPKSPARSLAGLMAMTGDEPAAWSPDELGSILRHQLAAPLEYDLRTIAPGGEQTIHNMTAAIRSGPRPRSFGDLIRHPAPPLDLLGLMKDFARTGRDSRTLPPEVGTVLYYAAIILGVLRQNTRITKLDDTSLRKGIEWSIAVPWIDQSLKQLFTEGLEKIPK
jgi:hypothetical protein